MAADGDGQTTFDDQEPELLAVHAATVALGWSVELVANGR